MEPFMKRQNVAYYWWDQVRPLSASLCVNGPKMGETRTLGVNIFEEKGCQHLTQNLILFMD